MMREGNVTKKIYTAAVVGTGRIGFTLGFDKKREQPASHTMALNANPQVKIIAGVDKNLESLSKWKEYNPSASTFESVEKMYEAFAECGDKDHCDGKRIGKNAQNCAPDIVVVAVNENAHLSVALEVISHRPRLLILEKPVALNLHEAEKIRRASKKFSVPILVNHERRFALDWNAAAEYAKKIGDIQCMSARLFSGMRLYDPDAESTGGYSLIHDGTHLADIVLFLLEAIQENFGGKSDGKNVGVILKKPSLSGIVFDKENKKIVRNLCAHYATKFCPSVNLEMSGRSRFFGFEVDVIGTEGRIFIGNGFAKFFRRAESKLYSGFFSLEEDSQIVLPKKGGRIQTGYFANMVQNAVDFLDGRAPLKSTLQTGTNALKVLDEIKTLLTREASV